MARPFVLIDGVEHAARWGMPVRIDFEPGMHAVAAGMRYRGFASPLGVRDVQVHVDDRQTIRLLARNGLFNHEPFYVRAAPVA